MMRSLVLAAVLCVAALDAATAQDRSASESVLLQGYIVDRTTAQPLSGALVEFPDIERRVLTNAEGRFSILGLTRGDHRIVVRMLGYEDYESTVRFGPDPAPITIAIGPDPIVLEGITAQGYRLVDLIDRRRTRAGWSSRVVYRDRIAPRGASVARDAVLELAGLSRVPCRSARPQPQAESDLCVLVRGHPSRPSVFIDDVRSIGGLRGLELYQAADLFMIEVFRGGGHIRVYTSAWMESEGRRNRRPAPLF